MLRAIHVIVGGLCLLAAPAAAGCRPTDGPGSSPTSVSAPSGPADPQPPLEPFALCANSAIDANRVGDDAPVRIPTDTPLLGYPGPLPDRGGWAVFEGSLVVIPDGLRHCDVLVYDDDSEAGRPICARSDQPFLVNGKVSWAEQVGHMRLFERQAVDATGEIMTLATTSDGRRAVLPSGAIASCSGEARP